MTFDEVLAQVQALLQREHRISYRGLKRRFGAPITHEDHPQRALYAALRMQEEMHRYGDHVRLKHGVPLAT
jgi:hypothetical protein